MAESTLLTLLALLLLCCGSIASQSSPETETKAASPTSGIWVVEMTDNLSRLSRAEREERARSVLARADLVLDYHQQIHLRVQGFYIARIDQETSLKRSHQEIKEYLESFPEIKSAELQVPLNRVRRGYFNDPIYNYQWHLENTGQYGAIAGNDVNVVSAWMQGIDGAGVCVAMVDDGLDYTHPDIAPSYVADASYDFNYGDPDPMPTSTNDYHGTRCAAEITAVPNNGVCGVGVAYRANISGIRLISVGPTSSEEAKALNYAMEINDIYSNSWGPTDDGKTLEAPAAVVQASLQNGISQGRNGLGSIFVFASGNGYTYGDDCNFDGYANSVYSIAIGAITDQGLLAPYSEGCSALMGVSYSSGGVNSIATSDVGGGCTLKHSGTSAAAPLVSGMIALALSVRSDLTWRDVQSLVVNSAIRINPTDPDWTKNGAGYYHHQRYGFGKIDANLMMENVKKWNSVGPLYTYSTPTYGANLLIAKGTTTWTTLFLSDGTQVPKTLEWVAVTLRLTHQSRKNLVIRLQSPEGTISILAPQRPLDNSVGGYDPWTFTTIRCWGENPVGTWTLFFDDSSPPSVTQGTLKNWNVKFYGTGAEQQQPQELNTTLIVTVSIAVVAFLLVVVVVAIYLVCRRKINQSQAPEAMEILISSDIEDFDSNPFSGPTLNLEDASDQEERNLKNKIDID